MMRETASTPRDPETTLARALWFVAPRTAELRSENVPDPGPGEVRVRSIVSAISSGTEMLVYRGEVAPEMTFDLPTFEGGYGFPIKYGYATVGRVLKTGPEVAVLRAGNPVFVHHPHQDEFNAPAGFVTRLPDGLDPSCGLFFANLETALNVVHDTPLRFGETAVVFGQGVVGLLVTRLLSLAGAGRVLAVDPLPNRRRLAIQMGADEALRPENVAARIPEVTDGRGADVAVEVSGAGAALQAAVDAAAIEGTVVAASWYGTKPVTLDLGTNFHRGRVRLRSSQVGHIAPELSPRWDRGRRTGAVLGLLQDDRLTLAELVSHRFPFDEAGEAFRLVDERPGETVQVVISHDAGEEEDV